MADFHFTPIKLHYHATDISGHRFGLLTVIAPISKIPSGVCWLCRCDCGNECLMSGHNFRWGKSKSCGCLRLARVKETNSTHGMSNTPTHKVWLSMRTRCENPNDKRFDRYGGRGITVCDRWQDFEAFLADMGERPSLAHSIDRIDNDGSYTPENCRWATSTQQVRNRSTTLLQEYNGITKPLADWADELGISYQTLFQRIHKLNWPIDRAMTEPVRGR